MMGFALLDGRLVVEFRVHVNVLLLAWQVERLLYS
jgi:hypothetical protein